MKARKEMWEVILVPYSFLARDTEAPHEGTRANLTDDPETRRYRTRYLQKDNPTADYSDVLVVTAPGKAYHSMGILPGERDRILLEFCVPLDWPKETRVMSLPAKKNPARAVSLAVWFMMALGITMSLAGAGLLLLAVSVAGERRTDALWLLAVVILAGLSLPLLAPGILYIVFAVKLSHGRPWPATAGKVLAWIQVALIGAFFLNSTLIQLAFRRSWAALLQIAAELACIGALLLLQRQLSLAREFLDGRIARGFEPIVPGQSQAFPMAQVMPPPPARSRNTGRRG